MSRGGLPGSQLRFDPGSFFAPTSQSPRGAQVAQVIENTLLCREHFRLTLRLARFEAARPGQFVHLCPPAIHSPTATSSDQPTDLTAWVGGFSQPMLRRAFSIAGLRRREDGVDVDVIYRVVGTATRWMQSLRSGDAVSVLGPLGNAFPIHETKQNAWLVAGGVGLPPMLWLAQALREAGKNVVAFCGAQSAGLMALTIDPTHPPDSSATSAALSAREFAQHEVPVVLSTDDGTLGYRGYVPAAMAAYYEASVGIAAQSPRPPLIPPCERGEAGQPSPLAPLPRGEGDPPLSPLVKGGGADLVVYTCGPERMMHAVAEFCTARNVECYVCVERNMACGTGMCQSCVVPVSDTTDPSGWSYRLCCTDGPIFAAAEVLW